MNRNEPASAWERYEQRNRRSTTEWFLILQIIVIFVFIPAFLIYGAKQESAVYNRLTGAHTTWWDALWVELRIQDTPK